MNRWSVSRYSSDNSHLHFDTTIGRRWTPSLLLSLWFSPAGLCSDYSSPHNPLQVQARYWGIEPEPDISWFSYSVLPFVSPLLLFVILFHLTDLPGHFTAAPMDAPSISTVHFGQFESFFRLCELTGHCLCLIIRPAESGKYLLPDCLFHKYHRLSSLYIIVITFVFQGISPLHALRWTEFILIA